MARGTQNKEGHAGCAMRWTSISRASTWKSPIPAQNCDPTIKAQGQVKGKPRLHGCRRKDCEVQHTFVCKVCVLHFHAMLVCLQEQLQIYQAPLVSSKTCCSLSFLPVSLCCDGDRDVHLRGRCDAAPATMRAGSILDPWIVLAGWFRLRRLKARN